MIVRATQRYYIVQTQAKMPSSVRHPYYHLAILQTDGTVPTRIDTRPRYVRRIVRYWPPARECDPAGNGQLAINRREALAELAELTH